MLSTVFYLIISQIDETFQKNPEDVAWLFKTFVYFLFFASW